MKRAFSSLRLVLSTAFLASLAPSVFAADEPMAPGVVELPKFVVADSRDLPPPESWRYATIPGFEILSNASEKETQRFIYDFEMFRQALGYVWPVPNRATRPTSLILTGKGAKFDAFVPHARSENEIAKASVFLKQGDRTAIVIDLQSTTLNVLNVDDSMDALTGTDSGVISVEHDKQLYREYVRFLMSNQEPRPPAWLQEGLAQIIMKMKFGRRYIEFARIEDPNTISASAGMALAASGTAAGASADGGELPELPGAPAEDRDFNVALQRRGLIPFDVFFAVQHDSPEAQNPLGNNRWAKQAYAFVHMCLYGRNGKFQKPFVTFLQRLGREPVTEAMFKECFNLSYSKMLLEIRDYCEFTVYEAKIMQSKKGGPDILVPPPALALREATQSEVGRIKGEALTLAGNEKQAHVELIAPYIRGERDPNLLAALGLHEREKGDAARARKFLEAAVAAKTDRGEAFVELARLRYTDASTKLAAPEGQFAPADSAAILDLLATGRKQSPRLLAVYELAADTWMHTAAVPKQDDAVALIDGARLFPGRLKLVYQTALVCVRAGLIAPAHTLADHGIKFAPDPAARSKFEGLKQALPPAPPTVPASVTTPAATTNAK